MTSPRFYPRIDRETRLVISIAERPGSFGNAFHNFLYRELGLNYLYKSFATSDPEGALRGVRALGLRGCGVTMPFKERVLSWLDELDAEARGIGAVNTIVNDDGRLRGFNTDWIAAREALRKLGLGPRARIALYGSGGMARAWAHAAKAEGCALVVVSRNERTGRELAGRYGFRWEAAEPGQGIECVVNATPVGMHPDPESRLSLPEAVVARSRCVVDSVAFPAETALIRLARSLGKPLVTGRELTLAQGREQFRLYTGVQVPDELMARAAAVVP